MLTIAEHGKIIAFFNAVQKISSNGNFEMGLLVKKPRQQTEFLLPLAFSAAPPCLISVSNSSVPEEILAKLSEALEKKQWIFLELADGILPARVYNQVRLLASTNRLDYLPSGAHDFAAMRQQPESRLIVLVSEGNLKKITHQKFLDLFGPIL